MTGERLTVKIADGDERREIYRLRHEIYARELRQHPENERGELSDAIDEINTYIVVKSGGKIAGFVSITPPGGAYGLDKYLSRGMFPFIYDGMFEGRLFSVLREFRGGRAALLLFWAVLRFAEEGGGRAIMTIGRSDLVDFYKKTGLLDLGHVIESGEVRFHVMYGEIGDIRRGCGKLERLLERGLRDTENLLPFPLLKGARCEHGGGFFKSVGEELLTLEKSRDVISADVLDAWFDPSPDAVAAVSEYLPWLMKTSPPEDAAGLARAVSKARGVPEDCVVPGGGSSELMYMALPRLLPRSPRVLHLDPTYGEYAFIVNNLLSGKTLPFPLSRKNGYVPDAEALSRKISAERPDMAVIVNPNSPTGALFAGEDLERVILSAPEGVLFWIDETYIDYAGKDRSLEGLAASRKNVIVCKSMSKCYALSGLRCAYLVCHRDTAAFLKRFSPPWSIGLLAQTAAVRALCDTEYYARRYRETAENRAELVRTLSGLGLEITSGCANWILLHLPPGMDKAAFLQACEAENLFLRDAGGMGAGLENAVRAAVKDSASNTRMAEIIRRAASSSLRTKKQRP